MKTPLLQLKSFKVKILKTPSQIKNTYGQNWVIHLFVTSALDYQPLVTSIYEINIVPKQILEAQVKGSYKSSRYMFVIDHLVPEVHQLFPGLWLLVSFIFLCSSNILNTFYFPIFLIFHLPPLECSLSEDRDFSVLLSMVSAAPRTIPFNYLLNELINAPETIKY